MDQHHHRRPGGQRAGRVEPTPRADEGDRQGAEELQRHRQPQADPRDRGVQGQVHHRVHQGQAEHRAPLGGGERARLRAGLWPTARPRPPTAGSRPRPAGRWPGRPGRPRTRPSGWPGRWPASGPRRRAARRAGADGRPGRSGTPGWSISGAVRGAMPPPCPQPVRIRKMHLTGIDTLDAWMQARAAAYGRAGAEAPALPGGHRGHRQLHRRRPGAGAVPGRGVPRPARAGGCAGRAAAAPHQPRGHPDHGRGPGPGPGPACCWPAPTT